MRRWIAALGIIALTAPAFSQGSCQVDPAKLFEIELIRLGKEVVDHGKKVERSYGDVGVNGQNLGASTRTRTS